MALPSFTMRQLLEAGVHFGHSTRRWNPKMAPFLFGDRNKIHIIDLQQTVPLLQSAMQAVRDVAASGGRVLFVGTKRQASERVAAAAKRSGQYYVNHRWLGGMMTNWQTISKSIRRLKDLEEQLQGDTLAGMTKKELLNLTRERDKLERALGGIKEMGALPDILVVIDTNKEKIAVDEANVLNIPVIGILDSNSDPKGISHPVPGNDDSIRAIELYCNLLSGAVLEGIQKEINLGETDLGAAEVVPEEALPSEADVAEAAAAPAAEDAGETKPAAKEEAAPKEKAAPKKKAAPKAKVADEPKEDATPEADKAVSE